MGVNFTTNRGTFMPAEFSAGAIIFRQEVKTIYYLLLHYEEGHWGSSKGHIENIETIEETARREIQEETGLTDIHFLDGFKELNQYYFQTRRGRVFKTVTFLLAETHTKDIRISFEHIGYEWLPFEAALEKVTFENEKQVFRKAHEFLLKNLAGNQ
jgi:8-oxo-dGTP pyrophosphatase MutT (NUDIX family)